jgi:hypothetical protein
MQPITILVCGFRIDKQQNHNQQLTWLPMRVFLKNVVTVTMSCYALASLSLTLQKFTELLQFLKYKY